MLAVSTEGVLMIYPDQSDHPLPALQYHFYNMDGSTAYLCLSCDGNGNFSGMIPAGTYRLVATNTDAKGVQFVDMSSHESAFVTSGVLTRSGSEYTLLNQPDNIYSVTLEDFTVNQGDTLSYFPESVLLTKNIRLSFTLQGNLVQQVTDINGVLHGVYSAVHLYSCTPTEEGVVNSPYYAVNFNTAQDATQWLASVNVFGLCDPEYGEVYRNTLTLQLTMEDESSISLEVELTDKLSDVIKENQGVIPVELSLEVSIDTTETGLSATVKDWKPGGESKPEV